MREWNSAKQSIVDYYNRSWPIYLKYIAKSNLGIHYGYYDRDHKNHHEAMLNMNNQVAIGLKLNKTSKYSILDAGCGVGGTIIHLAKSFPKISFTGITISNEQIELANGYSEENNIEDQVTFLNRDYLDTKFPDNSFDAVYSIESMCYAYDKHVFIKEAKRILKPGGILTVLDGFRNGEYPLKPSLDKRYDHWCEGWALEYKLDTQINIKKYLEEEGFQSILYRDITRNILPSCRRIYNLAVKIIIEGYFIKLISGYDYDQISKAGLYQRKPKKTF
ncbi:MAG: methyltransferase domain-containing protein [Promethearchaeota archaeon]|jgi:ubiquinone/menaquinone biosynthesis C-methylase UbiE